MTYSTAEERRARPYRWIALGVASVLLHVLAFNWANGRIGLPSMHEEKPSSVSAVLLPPPPPVVQAAPPTPAAVKPKPKPKPKRPAPVENAPVATPAPSEPAPDTLAAPLPDEPVDTDAEPAADVIASATAEAAEQSAARYTVSPPPSAQLQYDVQAVRKGQNWFGNGTFDWKAAGDSYSVVAKASVSIIFSIDVLDVKSEGAINDFGIAPVLYSEKPWRKSMINTHFRHAEKLISFSASEATYPYQGGEQDRASVIWQLAGIGRGDARQFAPGAEIDIFVAGKRNAETWRMQVINEEEIDTPYGKLSAWHVMRLPRAGTHDERLDIWLAPQHEWYPARVRYTYANGDHFDLSLSGIATPAAQ